MLNPTSRIRGELVLLDVYSRPMHHIALLPTMRYSAISELVWAVVISLIDCEGVSLNY
jgi:hypothetical protein